MIKYDFKKGYATIYGVSDFNEAQTLDCGQCFRFEKSPTEGYEGIIGKSFGRVVCRRNGEVDIYGADEGNIEKWIDFLALDMDYSVIKRDIADKFTGETIKSAMDFGYGIRILRQDKWETICSFIISQNNNIPRIKKIIATLCERFGEPFERDGKKYYAFPSAKALLDAGEEAVFECKTGFRAKYIIAAAEAVCSGKFDIEKAASFDNETLINELCKIKGIGPKVASCISLYGYGHYEAFPIDVWVKRIIDKYYGGSLDISSLGSYAGIGQQYLFYYERIKENGIQS